MKQDESILEAEVVEIDGVAVEPRPEIDLKNARNKGRLGWKGWQGKILMLDKRWMPLWIALGIIAAILLLTVGLLVAVFAVIFWLVKTILRSVFSVFNPTGQTLDRKS